jgi:hypothetical protein
MTYRKHAKYAYETLLLKGLTKHSYGSIHTAFSVQNSFCSALEISDAGHKHSPLSNQVDQALVTVYV